MRGWMWLLLGDERFLVFGYVDPHAGPSAKGVAVSQPPTSDELAALDMPRSTFRMPMGEVRPLTPPELERFTLPAEPSWMEFYRPQETAWSADPRLQGAFHADYPNDLQAMFFMPASGRVESMWVKVHGVDEVVDGYLASLLNNAEHDSTLRSGTEVTIRPTAGLPQPVWVSDVMRANLGKYRGACTECGFDLVMVPVETLIRTSFPDVPADALLERFTTRCALCSGTQILTATRN